MNRLQSHHLPAAVGRVRESIREADHDLRTDPDLLERFARYGEHPAFEAILRRHGPMVLGVCRRTLVNPADVDDAFQATFLVLIRKARSIRKDRLGPWLYGVAFRVALKARGRAARVAARQTEVTDMIPDPTLASDPPDWLPILDAELSALPANYREPMVLCELQGLSRAEAARGLGIPEGTLSSRLSRGREMLRKRLLRYGTLLPAGGLAALLSESVPGRATVPAGLLARTAELAATGLGASGAVPAGPARLTDEVVKDMFLMKLRVMGGAVLAAGLVAVGLVAGWPAEAPGQPNPSKPAARVAESKSPSTKLPTSGQVQSDRDAIQGLWVLDKFELGEKLDANAKKILGKDKEKIRVLINGDVMWGLVGPDGTVSPYTMVLDPSKNPKWLDLNDWQKAEQQSLSRGIYELEGDQLRIGMMTEMIKTRPAEFTTDEESGLTVLHFRREPALPLAGEKGLIGSWVGEPMEVKSTAGIPGDGNFRWSHAITLPTNVTLQSGNYFTVYDAAQFGTRTVLANPIEGSPASIRGAGQELRLQTITPKVEILGGFLFAYVPKDGHPNGVWIGGRYTVDMTKNPKWIDVDLVGPYPNEKVTKLHGCYDTTDGQLKLALGLTGKRVLRPLHFGPAPTDSPTWFSFNLKRVDTPLSELRKVRAETPQPKAPPPHPKADQSLPLLPGGLSREQPDAGRDPAILQAQELIRTRKFAEAEDCLRRYLQLSPEAGESPIGRCLLGVCLLEQTDPKAKSPVLDLTRAREEALGLFKQLVADVNARRQAKQPARNDEWLYGQSNLRILQAYLGLAKPYDVLFVAAPLRLEFAGRVEELIVLSWMFHAYKLLDASEAMLTVRSQIQDVFQQLKDKPGAFPGGTKEYTREYWEKEWLAPDTLPMR